MRAMSGTGARRARAVPVSSGALWLVLLLAGLLLHPGRSAPRAADPPGAPAPAPVIRELRATVAQAVQRFEAKDEAGVLAHVSDQYRTGPLTKPAVRAQLLALFQVYDVLRASVRIDDVRMVGEHAWVYSTGEVTGRLPFLGHWMTLYAWQRELEVARREGFAWRLYGYQQ
jgi:hypothetical protein